MKIPKVRLLNDPVLRQKARLVTNEELSSLSDFIAMMYVVAKQENGIGLAANQVGDPRSVFILDIDGIQECFINAEILSQEGTIQYEEGCLSIPGAMGKTERFNKVTLRYTKPLDSSIEVRHEEVFEGKKAVAIQHEMDHLNGKLYIDQFGPVKKNLVVEKHRKYLKKLSRSKN